jgi:hypothetical protein
LWSRNCLLFRNTNVTIPEHQRYYSGTPTLLFRNTNATIPEHQRYYSGTPTLLFWNANVQPRVVLCPLLFLIFYLAIIFSVRLRILASDYPFGTFKWFPHRKRCSVPHYLHLFVGGLMSYLRYLCFLVCFCIQHILCCGFLFCSSYVLCTQCCQFLWIFHSWMHLRFSITFIL